MSGADEVSAVEGASAVLPCTFTHPGIDHNLSGSVLWYKRTSLNPSIAFNCTFAGPGRSQCDEVTQEAGGSRFRFVGNLREGDASIMMERLRWEDWDIYRCRLELSVGNFQSVIPTQLTVEDLDGDVSVVTETEGGSATLPCVYRQSLNHRSALTVTWMRKDPYRHIVTFRHQADGSWAAENGATRFELVGNPERENASTRINQLSVEDSDGYLCLVEFSKEKNYDPIKYIDEKLRSSVHPPYTHQYQREVQLRVRITSVTQSYKVLILWIPLGLKTIFLSLMCVIFYYDKLSKSGD
ncbi:uncharacterized protein LOC116971356 [Amblyraja radiata]|uniref:uncharacterized protein LOC116971356 n=1 Tax=Amblyraja radiata TaxID=386614 RepID=UPI0014035597|nr:uncharacterized protein LOC116971356 [Amblyraja radiata]